MLKRCAVLMILLLFAVSSAAFAGASGGGGTIFTSTTTTNTVNQGTVLQETTVNSTINWSQKQGGNQNLNGSYTYNSVQFTGNGSNFTDTLTNQFGSPGQSLYWNFPWANPSSGTLSGSQITADNINPMNAGDTANTISGGCATVVSQSSSLQSSSSFNINLGSTTSSSTTVYFIQIGTLRFETVIDTNVLITNNVGTGNVDTYNALASLLEGNGNNGVGNGLDPQPPGNPPVNDGTGTSPGNPGNKGGTPSGNTVTCTATSTTSVSPIVLDLSHSGVLDASAGNWLPHQGMIGKRLAFFDFDANSTHLLMEWVGPKAGLLVEPKADGSVDGSCLFGTTGGFNSGYEKLALRDKNGDHLLTRSELAGLYLWIDSNSNGRVDSGELHSLAELKITEIDLRQRNYQSTFVMNGKRETMWDWWPNALAVRKTKVATQ